jgi:hypothetical protein
MADKPISLSRHRKARARAEKQARADANVVKFGRSKAERAADAARAAQDERRLDGHRRDDASSD